MPGMDNTGPMGTGAIGRRMGPCSGGQYEGRGFFGGRRFFGGRGFFHGGRWMMAKVLTPEEEKSWLEQQKSWLESQINPIVKRLQELENKEES